MTIKNSKIIITEPVLESDFESAAKLIWENVSNWPEYTADYFKNLSVGEILVAKSENKVVGVISMKRPGKIFDLLDEKYFSLDKTKAEKKDIGHVAWLVVDKDYQGKGIGKKLLSKGLINQKEFGSKCVSVHVWQGSPGGASQKVFESFGFEPIKMHKAPWFEASKSLGPKKFNCVKCGCPCKCDELEMVKYL